VIWLFVLLLVVNVVYAIRLLRLTDQRRELAERVEELATYLQAACDDADDAREATRLAKLDTANTLIVARAMGTAVCHALAGDNQAARALVTEYTNREGDAS